MQDRPGSPSMGVVAMWAALLLLAALCGMRLTMWVTGPGDQAGVRDE